MYLLRNSLFFRHNYIPAPYSIYKDIKKPSKKMVFVLYNILENFRFLDLSRGKLRFLNINKIYLVNKSNIDCLLVLRIT